MATKTVYKHKDVEKTELIVEEGEEDSYDDNPLSCPCPTKGCKPVNRCTDRSDAKTFGCGSVGVHLSAGSFWLILLVVVLVVILTIGLMNRSRSWYQGLKKSSWTPPPYIFNLIWLVLYGLFVWGFYRGVEGAYCQSTVGWVIVVGAIFLILNVVWGAFFGNKMMRQAFFVHIIMLVVAIIWTVVVWKVDSAAGVLQLPLCLFLAYGLFLQWQLIYLNGL